ncbi:MAG: hypothetical protein LBJ36_06990 [Synergistaceae bacterium]|nr:hypothetical protein [Synergistaceae bacterium]
MRYGVPMEIYTDKHTIFRSPKEKMTLDEELDGVQISLSNFGKAMVELGIQHIRTNTPQVKGRIERKDRASVVNTPGLFTCGIEIIENQEIAARSSVEEY